VIFQPGRKNVEGDVFDRFAHALLSSEQEGEGLPELTNDGATTSQLATELRSNAAGAALLIRGALNQVAAVHREREAHQIRDWIEESQEAGRSADAVRYEHLLAGLTQRETRLALVIDQAEELFTCEDLNQPESREKFATALTALVRGGRVFVLMTLRTDLYPRLQELPALIDLKGGDGQYDLLLPMPAEIAQLIRQPEDFGDVSEAQKRPDQAMAAYQQADVILWKLVQQDPTNGVWQRDLSMGLGSVGDLLKAEGKLDQALELYQQTRDILQKPVEQDPSNGRWQANLARAYLRLGEAFQLKVRPVEARATLVRARELLTLLQNEHQLSAEARTLLEETEKQLAEMK